MANYSLVVNSKFRPFEYQELLAPVLMATQAHHELEDKYAELNHLELVTNLSLECDKTGLLGVYNIYD